MKCGYCGKVLKDNVKFCTGCGHNISESRTEQSTNNSKNAYVLSIATLVMLIIIILAGSICMIVRGLNGNTVSNSDTAYIAAASSSESQDNSAEPAPDEFHIDSSMLGQWTCSDKTAAGYTASDYGIETELSLTLNEQGQFSINYRMTDTGISARKVKLTGSYSAENGCLTLKPDLSNYNGSYFETHGTKPSVKYSVSSDTLTISAENGKSIRFTRVS